MSATSALFTPLKAGSVTLRNRVGMSALTRNRASATGIPTDLNVEYYRQRAAGNAGIIVSEGVLVGPQGTEWPYAPGIWNDEQVSGWKKVVDAVHGEGAKIFAQLWHLGRVSHPDAPQQKEAGIPVYAPSAVAARGGKFRFIQGEPGYVTPTAIEDPSTLLPLWKKAAINAKAAGFDGVEIHGANGYLIHQFLDSAANIRTDAWGGSPQKRARFALEVLKTVSEVYGADRVSIKLSPTGGYNDVGMPLDETVATFSHLITEADKLKLAYICLVRYSAFTDIVIDGKNRATKHDVVETYAPLIKNSAKFANSGFTGEEAAKFIANGTLDGVFFGVPWITNPDVAKRLEAGKELNMNVDFMTLYGTGSQDEEVQKKGYTNYPTAT